MSDAGSLLDMAFKVANLVALAGGAFIIVSRLQVIGQVQAKEIAEMKNELVKMRELMTEVAVQKTRIDNQASQITMLDKRYEELRHGEGFVYPLGAHLGKRSVDK